MRTHTEIHGGQLADAREVTAVAVMLAAFGWRDTRPDGHSVPAPGQPDPQEVLVALIDLQDLVGFPRSQYSRTLPDGAMLTLRSAAEEILEVVRTLPAGEVDQAVAAVAPAAGRALARFDAGGTA